MRSSRPIRQCVLLEAQLLQSASNVIFGDLFPLWTGRVPTVGRALRPRTF
jgi:hypothetical protein